MFGKQHSCQAFIVHSLHPFHCGAQSCVSQSASAASLQGVQARGYVGASLPTDEEGYYCTGAHAREVGRLLCTPWKWKTTCL